MAKSLELGLELSNLYLLYPRRSSLNWIPSSLEGLAMAIKERWNL
jgi:hypothetical protein